MCGLMVKNIMENGKIIKWMDMVNSRGLMVKNILGIIYKIKNQVSVRFSGLVAKNMLENGSMENNMGKVLIIAPEVLLKMVNGKMEKESPGLIKANSIMMTD